MPNYKTSFKAYSAWNYEQEIEDLNKASEQGWQLVKGGCFYSRFEENPDIRYRYQVDFGRVDNIGRYIETFREQGWEYINSTFNGWHYFRKLYDPSLPEEEYEIFTDRQSLSEMQHRWGRFAMILGIVIFLFAILFAVRAYRQFNLPHVIAVLLFLIESTVLTRGASIMNDADSSKNRKGSNAFLAVFMAVIVIGAASMITLEALRPGFTSNQSATSMDIPKVDEEWLDFTLNQAGHGDYVISANDYTSYLVKHNDKPFVEGEAFYEFCSTLEENGTRMVDATMVRRVAYMTIQSGGAGYTYGAQGIWDCVLAKGTQNAMSLFNKYDVTWYEAILGEGAIQMGYMKDFYLNEDFTTLHPYVTEMSEKGNPFGKKLPLVTHNAAKTHWVLYYPASTRSTTTLKGFNHAKYELRWFDVRTGQYSKPFYEYIEGEWKIIKKPDQEDYCLVLKQLQED